MVAVRLPCSPDAAHQTNRIFRMAVLVEARTIETNRVILLKEGTSKLGGII